MSSTVEKVSEAVSVEERYQALIRVSQAITAHKNLNDLFSVLFRELLRVIEFDAMVVGYHPVDSATPAWHVFDAASSKSEVAEKSDNEIWDWVFSQQKTLVVGSISDEKRFPRTMKLLLEKGMQSICMLPLTTVHRRIGVIGMACRNQNGYGNDDLRFLSLVADQTALAIDDALTSERLGKAQQRLKQNGERLQLLLHLNNALVTHLDLRELFLAVSANIREVMRCDLAGLALPDSSGELQGYVMDFPDSDGTVGRHRPVLEEIKTVFRTGKPVMVSLETITNPGILGTRDGLNFGCFVPLVSRNLTLGVLGVGRRALTPITSEEVELLTELAKQVSIAVQNALAFQQIAELKDQVTQQNIYLEGEIRSELNFEEIVGKSEALGRVLRQVETVAPTDSTVLIYGDTGSGKELIARALHNLSARANQAFVKLNCAAIPTGLLESELFGHERGAFTGAVAQRIGRFELASKGSVFLDEIGEIPLELQPKLLRVLQEREFERLGSSQTLRSDARLIAATNRDLSAMVKENKFRADLFYRLSVFPLYVPPLRERPEDIPLLVRHFAQHFSRRMNRAIDTIPSESLNVLMRYDWPGNIRELQNLIERAVILSTGPVLKIPLQDLEMPARATAPPPPSKISTLEEAERRHILDALTAAAWVIAGPKGAAALLGLKRSTLQARMEKLGIRRARTAG